MRERDLRYHKTVVFLLLAVFGFSNRLFAQQDQYASQLISNSTDFQHPQRAVDSNENNYAYLSDLLGVLSTSYLQVGFAQSGKAGDVVNVIVQGTGQLLGTSVLNDVTVLLYDSLGNQVSSASGSNLLQLSLLDGGTNKYAIRYITSPTDTFKFKQVRLQITNLLSVSLNEFRVYSFFIQTPCPPVYASSVHDYDVPNTALLTLHGGVYNPNNALGDANTAPAVMYDPLSLLGLIPSAYLDLQFPQNGRAGDYVGVTIGQDTSLLNLGLIQDISLTIYDENGVAQQTASGFTLANLQLLSGGTPKYLLGFVSQAGNYRISRVRINFASTIGLGQNLDVYNAFHYAIDNPTIQVATSGPTTFCQGGSVTLTATDSFGYTNFVWSNGATTPSITVSQSGTYTVTVSDSLSCDRTSIPITVVVSQPSATVITGDTVLCPGPASGTLFVSSADTAYAWSNGSTADSLNISGPGKYYVTTVDSNGCSASDTVMVRKNNITVTPTITAAGCSNSTNGAISLSVANGSGSYSYTWSQGGTGNAISNLDVGLYGVIIKDNVYSCTYNKSFTVTAAHTLSLKTAIVNASGNGTTDGKVTLGIVGGSGTYTYAWSNGATTANLDNLAAGIYTVIVTDGTNGCEAMDTVIVSDDGNNLQITATPTANTSCNTATGGISVAVTGGSGSYTYLWSNGATTASVSNLTSGTYYLLVKDNSTNAAKTVAVTVNNNSALTVSGTTTDASCGGSDGSIAAPVAGGSGNYTYSWSNGATTGSINNLQAGIYILKVTDNTTGCSTQKIFNVGETTGPAVTLNVTQPGSTTNTGGGVTVTATGNYTYLWSNGSTSKNQTNLLPGTYSVTVTDTTTGCSSTYIVNISAPMQMSITASPISNTACAASADGSVDVAVTGGTAPYTYSWSNGAATQNIGNLNAGTYTLTATDAIGATATISVPVITDSAGLLHVTVATTTAASCNTATNGGVTVTVTGGQAPYTYAWSNGAATQNLTNVTPGSYTLTITDTKGCTQQLTTIISIDTANSIHIAIDSVTGAHCSGSNGGDIYATVTGGTAPYTYAWSNSATTQDLTNIGVGTYTLTSTDHVGCSTQATAAVGVDTAHVLHVFADSTHSVSCNSSTDGNIYVHVSNGVAPYTYLWSNNATTEDLMNVGAGTYTLTVTDAAGCIQQVSATVSVSTANAISVAVDSTIGVGCSTSTHGDVYVTVTGGHTPYTYSWSDSRTTEDLLSVAPATYTLTVTDAVGCSQQATATVSIDPTKAIQLAVDSTVSVGCTNSAHGDVYITTTGGDGALTYAWSNGSTTENLLNVVAGSYNLTVTDASGCSQQATASIAVDPTKAVQVAVDSTTSVGCTASTQGAVYVTASGGQTPYTYSWTNGSTSEDLTGVTAGSYTITVSDAAGCSQQASADVIVDTAKSIHIAVDSTASVGCTGSTQGAVYVTVTGGQTPYTYSWTNGGTSEDLTGITAGSYTITVSDAAGCSQQASANVVVDTAQSIHVAIDSTVNTGCVASTKGDIYATVTGGEPPYTYAWSDGSASLDLLNVAEGNYTLTVTDAAGCTQQASSSIVVDTALAIHITEDSVQDIGCNGNTTGAIYVSVTGGDMPYTYAWSDNTTAQDLLNAPLGNYTLAVTDGAGCTATLNAAVITAPVLDINNSVTNVTCYGANNGSVAISVSGGSGNYLYEWVNGNMGNTGGSLAVGNYTVNVKDRSSGCTQPDTFSITQPDSLVASFTATDDSCSLKTGTVTINITGGTSPYTYAWSDNETGSMLNSLAAGSYTVTITDMNNCQTTLPVIVGQTGTCNLVVHDVITPNGDGVNDYMVIEGIQQYPRNEVRIFDKWGDVVYSKTGYNNDWSGKGNNGMDLPGGTYYYLVNLNDPNIQGGKNNFTGSILIQR